MIPSGIIIRKTLAESFVVAFSEQVQLNRHIPRNEMMGVSAAATVVAVLFLLDN